MNSTIRGKKRVLLYTLVLFGVMLLVGWAFNIELGQELFPWYGVGFILVGAWILHSKPPLVH